MVFFGATASPTRPKRRGRTRTGPCARGLALGLIFGAALLAGCGDAPAPTPAGCPNDLPTACPATAPTFTVDIDPIFTRRCRGCHVAGGPAASRPFDDYAELHAARSAILNQVYACRMPPAEATPLDAAERAALLAWLVCGAPP